MMFSFRGFLIAKFPFRRSLSIDTKLNDKPLYITTPVFYVNSTPHRGRLYTTVLADAVKRWFDLKGHKTVFLTGTDEHGLKIQKSAEKAGLLPIEFCDRNATVFKELLDRAQVSYTDFLRTTEERHRLTVDHLWMTLKGLGFIKKDQHEGWYSISDETFVAESAINEVYDSQTHEIKRYSKESGHPLELIKEENYKFLLSKLKRTLLDWLDSSPSIIRPSCRYNEAHSWLEGKDLNDLSISRLRSRLEWGWPVPDDNLQTIYVWFDALSSYLTGTRYPWNQDTSLLFPPDYQIMGKDILRFHAIYWPAFLSAANLPLPKTIIAHAHWTVNTTKMSKSLGNVIDPFSILQDYGTDPVRYFLLREGPLNDDVDFSRSALERRINSDLADQLGNLLSRCLYSGFYEDGHLPLCGPLDQMDSSILEKITRLPHKVNHLMSETQIQHALEILFEIVADINRYFTYRQPWELRKDPSNRSQLDTTLYITLEGLRIVSILLKFAMPSAMDHLLDILGVPKTCRTFSNTCLETHSSRRASLRLSPSPLFTRHK